MMPQVGPVDLTVIALAALAAVWHFPTLRPIGGLLLIAALATFVTRGLPVEVKGLIYLPLDVIGGLAGLAVWIGFRERAGAIFFASALACCVAHYAMFSHPPHTKGQALAYIVTLNCIFIATCVAIGGTGLARSHRHIWQRRRDHRAGFALGNVG